MVICTFRDESLVSLAREVQELKVLKRSIGWPLMKVEMSALEGDSDDESDSGLESTSDDEPMEISPREL